MNSYGITRHNPALCPLCGGDNDCQLCSLSTHKGPCWCAQVEIPTALLERVPDELKNRACICRNCVEQFNAEQSIRDPRHANSPRGKGFTLVELLVVMAILAILSALLLPALARSRCCAQRADCVSNLHQLGIATQMYWDENNGNFFRWLNGSTNGGQIYWFGWLGPGAEGTRPLDFSYGVLYPYLQASAVRLCPSLNYALARFKLKASKASYGYGYNLALSAPLNQPPVKTETMAQPGETTLFADAAQVNDFQAPASRSNPMLEEWYYVDETVNYPNGHFRHTKKANVNFGDGHIGGETMVPGSLDQRLPDQFLGRLRPEILVLK